MPLSRRSLGCLLFLAACGDDASESIDAGAKPPADAAADRVPDGNGTPLDGGSPNELNCVGVFDCVTVCAEGDDACVEACLASASEASLALVNAVLTCAEQLGCTEEDCLALSCEPELLACAGTAAPDAGVDDAAAAGCDGAGIPEMTGPVSGLETSYAAGALIEVGVAVDEDTARVIVGIYEVGSSLYLGGTAEEVAPSSTSTLRFYAGVADGRT